MSYVAITLLCLIEFSLLADLWRELRKPGEVGPLGWQTLARAVVLAFPFGHLIYLVNQ